VARLHDTCSVWSYLSCEVVTLLRKHYLQSAIHSRLGWTENVHFLEQFRYLIVASQLLNDLSNPKTCQRLKLPPPTRDGLLLWEAEKCFVPSPRGLALTATTAFALAWSIRWLMSRAIADYSVSTILLSLSIIGVSAVMLYYYFRRQWLRYLRIQAIESASSLTSTAQDFDAAASTGITLVREVELVSRGYNMCVFDLKSLGREHTDSLFRSSPLPPITRLDETNQIKRCARLRRTIHRSLITMFAPYYEAYQSLKIHAVGLDLEKYYDVYEISRTDMEDAELVAHVKASDIEDADTLQDLKVGLQKLHIIRKLLLCTLLALNADGSKLDFQRWSEATEAMKRVTSLTAKMIYDIDEILEDEEGKLGDFSSTRAFSD